ncbi:MAG: HEAT repeat domain-containing protein [Cyanobacteria bacterium P01_C01_bin.89]
MNNQQGEITAESLTLEEAIANLRSDDPSLRYYAAWWVGRFRVDLPEVIDALIDGLEFTGDAEDGVFPLQRNVARALGKLDDCRAVNPLIAKLTSPDFYVREAAAQSLGMLGGPQAIEPLRQLLTGGVAAAVQVPGKPHLVQPYDSILEALGELGATESIAEIEPFVKHPLEKVAYGAARAMYQLTGDAQYGEKLVQALQGPDLQLRRAALSDVGAIGYLEAAKAIFNTEAENSLKLYSLKGLLEHPKAQGSASGQSQGGLQGDQDSDLTAVQTQIMDLMDGLL